MSESGSWAALHLGAAGAGPAQRRVARSISDHFGWRAHKQEIPYENVLDCDCGSDDPVGFPARLRRRRSKTGWKTTAEMIGKTMEIGQ